jgi:predicted nucleic acid-binding protein
MAGTVLVDTGFLVALLRRRDNLHGWAASQAVEFSPPWHTCESVLSEAFHLLRDRTSELAALMHRGAIVVALKLDQEQEPVLALMRKYSSLPMSLADACLVRMTEITANSVVLTTDTDFRIYRRHSRQVVPCVMP